MNFRDDIKEGSDGTYIKLKDGESIKGIFRGNPNEFYTKWENRKPSLAKEGEPGAKFRFRIKFVVKTDAGFVAKVFEGPAGIYNKLKELNEEYGLEQTVIKITRNGMGLETEYSLLPLREAPSKETMDAIDQIKLADLNFESKTEEKAPEFDTGESLPF